jgi:hypothetical protein
VNTEKGKRFMAEMAWAPGLACLTVDARSACGCGCGKPARVEFSVAGRTVAFIDPIAIDAVIATLVAARRDLWGPPAPKGGE